MAYTNNNYISNNEKDIQIIAVDTYETYIIKKYKYNDYTNVKISKIANGVKCK